MTGREARGRDDAVSPVIAVILMVAITVVMSATVYVWSTSFNQPHDPASKNLAASQQSPHVASASTLELAVLSVSPGFFASYLQVNDATKGTTFPFSATGGVGTLAFHDDGSPTHLGASDYVGAGDQIELEFVAGAIERGDTLELVEKNAGAVIARYVVR